MLEQAPEGAVAQPFGLDRHRSRRMETEQVQPSERGSVLVLLADRLSQHLDLYAARFLGELPCRHSLATKGVKRVQEPDREAARPAEPGRGRVVAHGADIDRRLAPPPPPPPPHPPPPLPPPPPP